MKIKKIELNPHDVKEDAKQVVRDRIEEIKAKYGCDDLSAMVCISAYGFISGYRTRQLELEEEKAFLDAFGDCEVLAL